MICFGVFRGGRVVRRMTSAIRRVGRNRRSSANAGERRSIAIDGGLALLAFGGRFAAVFRENVRQSTILLLGLRRRRGLPLAGGRVGHGARGGGARGT